MFAFQNLNQMLFHLSQVTCTVPAGSVRVTSSTAKAKAKARPDVNVVCSDSFFNTLRTFQQSENANIFRYLPKVKFGPSFKDTQWLYFNNLTFKFTAKKSVKNERLIFSVDKIICPNLGNVSDALTELEERLTYQAPWRVNYTSSDSFETNKKIDHILSHSNYFTRKPNPLNPSVIQNLLNSRNVTFMFKTQARNFKTERTMKAEDVRNPGLFLKFKNALDSEVMKVSSKIQNETNKNLKVLLSEKNLTTEEKQRTQIAFAEGYMTASSQPGSMSASILNWIKIITSLLVFALAGYFLYQNPGSALSLRFDKVEIDPTEITVTFDDVKGADEAKQDLREVVEYLKNPQKFSNLGGKLPKGVLLVGPPGTGKTLLARAVAGEARVPFFHASGSEFDEILVGQGAKRVRELFRTAKERAPCVIFIDEIDSVGAKRTSSVLHPYANQTINQLLSEMDGFHQNTGVIVLGATNRKNQLDQAILRPGRFDIEINVSRPDLGGRREILDYYLTKILGKDIDADKLARGTTGFTGADLENLVNTAALRAAMDGAEAVTMKHFEYARDRILMGPEKRFKIPDEETNIRTAYHEGGHAIVTYYTKDASPLHKVTIIPRGSSLGHTSYLPDKERHYITKSQYLAQLDACMGGRAAEELVFGPEKVTSGAANDLVTATNIASAMVKRFGMSDKLGLRYLEANNNNKTENFGQVTNDLVDSEIKKILQESYDRAKAILKSHAKEHKLLAEALLQYETLDAKEVTALLNGQNVNSKAAELV